MTRSDAYATSLTRAQRTATVIAIIGLVASIVLVPMSGGLKGFFESYLYAFIFWVGLTLGHLFLLMLQHVAGGPWGAIARSISRGGRRQHPRHGGALYPGLDRYGQPLHLDRRRLRRRAPPRRTENGLPQRSLFHRTERLYFAIWIALAYFFQRWSKEQDSGKPLAQKMRNVAAPGIILYILAMTFAAIDWAMSLTPEWFSGMYGVIFMIGQAISAVALVILMLVSFRGTGELSQCSATSACKTSVTS